MKKIIKIFLMTLLIVLFALTFTACGLFGNSGDDNGNVVKPTYSYEGSGTATNPYQVYTREDFAAVGQGQNVYHKLMNNLDLSGDDWTPIVLYKNTFDGGGFTISGTTYFGITTHSLFNELAEGSTVKNLNVFVEHGYDANMTKAGGICAWNNRGTIKNCSVTGKLFTGNNSSVGGIAALNNGTITECAVDVDIDARTRSSVGGIVGGVATVGGASSSFIGTISLCSSKGTITASVAGSFIGGVAGYGCGTIKQSFSEMAINLKGSTANNSATSLIGGIAAGFTGDYAAGLNVAVTDCYFTGEITAITNNAYAGGLIGLVDASTKSGVNTIYLKAEMTTSYVNADIAASTGTILNIVLGNNKVDAFSAGSSNSKEVSNCFDARETDIRVGALVPSFDKSIWHFDNENNPTLNGVKIIENNWRE